MPKKIARIELCRESLKRIISNLIEVSPFGAGQGKCKYCGEVRSHDENCIYETAGLVTRNVRSNKKESQANNNRNNQND
jgi:hypothetical protein